MLKHIRLFVLTALVATTLSGPVSGLVASVDGGVTPAGWTDPVENTPLAGWTDPVENATNGWTDPVESNQLAGWTDPVENATNGWTDPVEG